MRRFFVDPAAVTATTARLTGTEAHHLAEVLRLGPGTVVDLFDGCGTVYRARVERVIRGEVETTILASARQSDGRPSLSMGVALLTGKKMDLVIQKATELGVDAIHPYIARHCTVKERNENKEERWQRIILEACKQCNRPAPPECTPAADFTSILEAPPPSAIKIIFWEREHARTLADLLPTGTMVPAAVFALCGPEGGFSVEEIDQAVSAGFTPVTLGDRILRAETAVIAGAAILQYLLGNLAATPGRE
ncbi:MAG: 16S rRNA (uracil(1498)-N(3))-methyltransferase [Desulfobulbaceae bacterium]|nr:16S rRNA (uracil(1498)-N(3))-methyltransferase [Desulfobulbaceae bacterium]